MSKYLESILITRKEEESTSHLYNIAEQKNPRQALKNIVRQRLGDDETTSTEASNNVSNELQMVKLFGLLLEDE